MRASRFLFSVALSASFATPALAQSCVTPADRDALDVRALVSELALHAKTCGTEARYNAFVHRYGPALEANEATVDRFFATQDRAGQGRSRAARRGDAPGQVAHDNFITVLANVQSGLALPQGSDFCPRNLPMFDEVMALENGSELVPYAAGKNLLPPAALETACAPAPAATSAARRPARRRR